MGRRGLRRGPRGPDAVHRRLAVLLLAGVVATPAGAAGGDDGRVAAAREGAEIQLLGTTGGRAGSIARTKNARPIAFSRDGKRLAYVRGETVYISRADGSGAQRVVGDALFPAWSPDGRYLAFSRARCAPYECIEVDNPTEIFVLDLRTKKLRRLTQNMNYDGEPEWSPDGRLLLFVRETGLFTMSPDGSHVNPLIGGAWSSPRWSPDGSRIAFDDFRDVYVLNLASQSKLRRMTPNPGPDHHASWSPDGKRIAYLSEHVCGSCYSAHDPWEVWVLDTRTRATRRITGKGFLAPVWAPTK